MISYLRTLSRSSQYIKYSFSIMIAGFLLFNLWKTKMISYLAKRSIMEPFDGIESLVMSSDFNIFVVPHSAQMDSFQFSKIPAWQKAWKERMEPHIESYDKYLNGRKINVKRFALAENSVSPIHFI